VSTDGPNQLRQILGQSVQWFQFYRRSLARFPHRKIDVCALTVLGCTRAFRFGENNSIRFDNLIKLSLVHC